MALQLSLRDAVLTILLGAVTVHLIFKRYEPTNVIIIVSLLAVLPSTASILLLPHYDVLRAVGISFLLYHLTLASSIVAYRLSPIHPLARYPGPLICKVSKLWMVPIARRGKQHIYIQSLHRKYGDVVRIGPNEISIRDVTAIQPLMGTQGLPKGPNWTARTLYPPILPIIATRDPVEHAQRRRPWNRGFSTAALKEYQPIIAKRVAQLVESLASEQGVVNLVERISFFTYDFMGDMAFGGGTEMLKEGDKDGLWGLIHKGLDSCIIYDHLPWLPHFVKLLPGGAGDIRKMRGTFLKRTASRFNAGSKTKDLFYYLSNEDGGDAQSPSPALVISDGALAVVAGSDTTASVLSNIFWCLLSHPEVYKRLQQEVDQYYPQQEDALDTTHHTKMFYLEAVINEALRLYPAVPSGSQRAPIPGEGDKVIGPYYLPEGTQARIHFWSVHRDPRNFSHPETFWPERWLIAEGIQPSTEKIVHNANAFIPFSFGPSNCVGKNLALQEMRIVVCYTMQKLEMRFAEGWDPREWEHTMRDLFVVDVGRLPVLVKSRQ